MLAKYYVNKKTIYEKLQQPFITKTKLLRNKL